mmetsp:Transcript_27247/g.70022  ORF Transcript_27247/g.70022 Transcript_27247/m.70022 type:complete len:448 (+) Transcript_27247:148-1491(+)
MERTNSPNVPSLSVVLLKFQELHRRAPQDAVRGACFQRLPQHCIQVILPGILPAGGGLRWARPLLARLLAWRRHAWRLSAADASVQGRGGAGLGRLGRGRLGAPARGARKNAGGAQPPALFLSGRLEASPVPGRHALPVGAVPAGVAEREVRLLRAAAAAARHGRQQAVAAPPGRGVGVRVKLALRGAGAAVDGRLAPAVHGEHAVQRDLRIPGADRQPLGSGALSGHVSHELRPRQWRGAAVRAEALHHGGPQRAEVQRRLARGLGAPRQREDRHDAVGNALAVARLEAAQLCCHLRHLRHRLPPLTRVRQVNPLPAGAAALRHGVQLQQVAAQKGLRPGGVVRRRAADWAADTARPARKALAPSGGPPALEREAAARLRRQLPYLARLAGPRPLQQHRHAHVQDLPAGAVHPWPVRLQAQKRLPASTARQQLLDRLPALAYYGTR